jgi:hypothetical protein
VFSRELIEEFVAVRLQKDGKEYLDDKRLWVAESARGDSSTLSYVEKSRTKVIGRTEMCKMRPASLTTLISKKQTCRFALLSGLEKF